MRRLTLSVLVPLPLLLTFACQADDGGDEQADSSETANATETAGTETETAGTETDTGEDPIEEPAPVVDWPTLGCDSLVPDYCMYPFPNNVFTAADANTPTGRRLALQTGNLPIHSSGTMIEAEPYNFADGFSPGNGILTYLPHASTVGLPTWEDLDASLATESPTVLIDAATGERVPHFAEIDRSLPGDTDGSFMIRPVERLKDNTRYIVAIRDVQNTDGAVIEPSPEFAALRDLTATADPDVEARRPLYTDIFARLGDAGVARETLQIAWDFTTASADSNTASLLHMRDDALEQLGDAAPSYTITSVDTDFNVEDIAYRIQGTVEVPLYLDQTETGARLIYGADGLPEQQGTAEFRFVVLIPQSALVTPAPLLQFGHGLLGDALDVGSEHLRTFANEYNYVVFALDWIGMASDDQLFIANMLTTGAMHDFEGVSDRLQQGVLNFIFGARMMRDGFAQDATYGQYIDASRLHYWGISQGGIFGGTYMAITPDIERGCLSVPGQPYNLLLNRSVDFDEYFSLLKAGYTDSRDLQMILGMIQMLWDRVEPTGYSYRIEDDPFADTLDKDVMIRAAVGDHQVTTLGAHIMARAVGATHVDTGIREVWGLESAEPGATGSTYVEYSFGLPADPVENLPQAACEDPHGKLRKLPEAREQLDVFFDSGVTENFCADDVCEFSDMSGC